MVITNIYCMLVFMLFSNTDMLQIRALYMQAPSDKTKTKELIKLLDKTEQENMTLQGYKASAKMLMASHSFNPYVKFKYFNSGKDMLENAIKEDKKNIELRFLRFAIQKNAPAILKYKNHLSEDKNFINTNIHLVNDAHLKQMIQSYLLKINHDK